MGDGPLESIDEKELWVLRVKLCESGRTTAITTTTTKTILRVQRGLKSGTFGDFRRLMP